MLTREMQVDWVGARPACRAYRGIAAVGEHRQCARRQREIGDVV